MNSIIAAIVQDDLAAVSRLLQSDPGLATRTMGEDRLFESGIVHWLYRGDTALHLAAAGHRDATVRRLLAAGADVHAAQNRRRSTPLHYASDGSISDTGWDPDRQVKTLRVLLEAGADLHSPDLNGATPLHRAVRTRCAAAVKFLLEAGADPRAENHSGSTPFHLAVQNTGRGGSGTAGARTAQSEIVRTFLAAGLDPHRVNSRGVSVADSPQSAWVEALLRGKGS